MDKLLTKLVVRGWAARLERELELLEVTLPADLPRGEPEREYVGPRALFGGPLNTEARENPANWRETPGQLECLGGLAALAVELRLAEDDLGGEGNDD